MSVIPNNSNQPIKQYMTSMDRGALQPAPSRPRMPMQDTPKQPSTLPHFARFSVGQAVSTSQGNGMITARHRDGGQYFVKPKQGGDVLMHHLDIKAQ